MPGVLCTCVLIGHILSSEISIIILSSEIFKIHFDDTKEEKKRQDSPKSLSNY